MPQVIPSMGQLNAQLLRAQLFGLQKIMIQMLEIVAGVQCEKSGYWEFVSPSFISLDWPQTSHLLL